MVTENSLLQARTNHTNAMRAVGDRTRAYRKQHKWDQATFADFAGVGETTIQQLESGKAPDVRLYTLYRIAGFLQISVGELLEGQR